jgi:hypothetical protein
MSDIELAEGAVKVDAAVIATDLGLRPEGVLNALRDRTLTAVCEQGLEQDSGRWRLTFYHADRRLRLVIDQAGRVLERSAVRQQTRRQGRRMLNSG